MWAENTRGGGIAYGVVAGVVWVLWMAVAGWSDSRRVRGGAIRSETGSPLPLTEKSGSNSPSVGDESRTV